LKSKNEKRVESTTGSAESLATDSQPKVSLFALRELMASDVKYPVSVTTIRKWCRQGCNRVSDGRNVKMEYELHGNVAVTTFAAYRRFIDRLNDRLPLEGE